MHRLIQATLAVLLVGVMLAGPASAAPASTVVGDGLPERQDAQNERVDVHLVAVDVSVELLDLVGQPDLGHGRRPVPEKVDRQRRPGAVAAVALGAGKGLDRPAVGQLDPVDQHSPGLALRGGRRDDADPDIAFDETADGLEAAQLDAQFEATAQPLGLF